MLIGHLSVQAMGHDFFGEKIKKSPPVAPYRMGKREDKRMKMLDTRGKRNFKKAKYSKSPCTHIKTRTDTTVYLKWLGGFDAEIIINILLRELIGTKGSERLSLDLTSCYGFDNLALSALLVILRKHAEKFEIIEVSGLPPWAMTRLARTPMHRLLDSNWQLWLEADSAVFCLETGMQAA